MGGFSDLFARLDPDSRVRGKQFEHVCKWFLTNDPEYTALLRRVWLRKEWPDRWSDAEAGIDLVAVDTNGHLCAVQAKAYADSKPIPNRELNKFLAESNTDQFSAAAADRHNRRAAPHRPTGGGCSKEPCHLRRIG